MSERSPSWETERLWVWEIPTTRLGQGHEMRMERVLYVAMLKTSVMDWPGVAVSLSVFANRSGGSVDWVQTADPVRGLGLAAELVDGVRRRDFPSLRLHAVTESGRRLGRAFRRRARE